MFTLQRIVGFGAGIMFCAMLHGQQYRFVNYSNEDGLTQSQVNTICQDQQGYLWMGTLGGLNRFDGRSFDNYAISDGLLDLEINHIYSANDGTLWVASRGGISKFTGRGFESYRLEGEDENLKVTSITEDGDGTIWITTYGGSGVYRLEDDRFDGVNTIDSIVQFINLCTDGIMRIGTERGVESFNGTEFIKDSSTIDMDVSMLLNDPNGGYWIMTYGQGVTYVGGVQQTYTRADGLISDNIRAGYFDPNGSLWLCASNGLSELRDGEFNNMLHTEGFNSKDLRTVFADREGNLWIGTGGKGVLQFTGKAFVAYRAADGLSDDIILGVVEEADGTLWFCTYNNGLTRFKDGTFEKIDVSDGLPHSRVWSGVIDTEGNIWFSTSGGVTRYDGTSFTNFSTSDGLPSKKATKSLACKDGSVMFATRYGVSIFRGDSIVTFSSKEGRVGKNVRSLLQASDGTIWAGTEAGLYRFENDKWTLELNDDNGLSANTIYSLAEDEQGRIWIGTENGLNVYDGSSCRTIIVDDAFGASFTAFLVEDGERMWVGTSNGLYALDLTSMGGSNEIRVDHYTGLEGLVSLECNQNSAHIDSQGFLWFGTDGALMRLDRKKLTTENKLIAPSIYLTDVRLFARTTDWTEFASEVNAFTGLPSQLGIDHKRNHFTFYFTGIYHSNPKKLEFKYMLEGFDEDWLPVTDADFATYSYLPHGQYTFKVLAGNGSGVWSEQAAQFSFEIFPPYWMTWWFYTACAVGFVIVVVTLFLWRMRVQRRKAATLQLEYRSKMLALEQQTLNASMNRHFIFNALNSIQYYINRQDKLSANRYLSSFAKLVRKNLDSSSSGNMVPLSEELERLELYLNLEHMRFQDKFSYEIVVPDHLPLESIDVPAMLLQPYVENSIWHGILPKEEHGSIKITVDNKQNGTLSIDITDDGIGFDQSQKNKLQDPNNHISKGMDITEGRIKLMREMTKQNIYVNGPYEVRENGTILGTKVEIVLPMN